MSRRVLAGALLMALAGLVTGCDRSVAADAGVELVDGAIFGPQAISAEADMLEVVNTGEFQHTLVITDTEGEVVAATGLIEPGEETYLDLDLEPGQYMFTCRLIAQDEEGNIFDHFEAGMHAAFTVEG